MAVFERVLSGIPEMDGVLDNIRLGNGPDDGQLFPDHLSVSLYSGHRGLFPDYTRERI